MQDKQLYVSDSKALHHILVKDQNVFEETQWFIQYVSYSYIFPVVLEVFTEVIDCCLGWAFSQR